nr:hypothetical protein [Armatimonadota bacterium]
IFAREGGQSEKLSPGLNPWDASEAGDLMNDCPHCGRKLLSKASVRCNWCGTEIEDPAYQAQAENEREAFFAHQAAHDAQSIANMRTDYANAYGSLGSNIPLINGPLLGFDPRTSGARQRNRQAQEDQAVQLAVDKALADQQPKTPQTMPISRTATGFPQRPIAAQTEPPAIPETPEETPEVSGDRFRHLEL